MVPVTDSGLPLQVLRRAQSRGILHNDCLASQKPCVWCLALVNEAFDHFYGHAPSEAELIALIFDDFLKEETDE